MYFISWTLGGNIAPVMKNNTLGGTLSYSYLYNIDNTGLVNRSVTKTNLQFICKTRHAYISFGWLNLFLEYRSDIVACIYWKHILGYISTLSLVLYNTTHPTQSPGLRLTSSYSISQEICTRFCCALLCCGYAIVHNEFTWSIYPYSSGLLCCHWGNR